MTYSVVHVTRPSRERFAGELRLLEGLATYPLGDDHFRLDHGADYFAFYDRLGEVHYYVAEERGHVIAAGCGVKRSVPDRSGRMRRAFYLADLKVAPDARGRRIPLAMLERTFFRHYPFCPRGFAVSMNPGEPPRAPSSNAHSSDAATAIAPPPNRVVTLIQRFRWARVDVAAVMNLYALAAPAMQRALPLVEHFRGRTGFLDLRSKKDLVLTSSGRRIPILHAQFGPLAERTSFSPADQATHMFMTPRGDALDSALRSEGFAPNATATVLAHRMRDFDFKFLLTSDV